MANKSTYEELEQKIKDLEGKVLLYDQALTEKNHKDEAGGSGKSNFLATVSHEIRTPLNGIIGFTEMLLETSLDDEQVEHAKLIRRCGESLLCLINDILDFSKIDAGRMEIEKIDFDLELLVYDVCELIRPRIGSKSVEIFCNIGDTLPSYVKGDPLRFKQVLINLMGNASKFTEDGTITLSIDIEEENDDRIKIHSKIIDTGIGIPKEKLPDVFSPFIQADDSTTRKFGGTGLGLSICKQIANIMEGNIWAESEIGQGSTFHFTSWLEKASIGEIRQLTPVSLKEKRILVVDDNLSNLEMLVKILEPVGMRPVTVEQGDQTVPTLENHAAQDVFFDIGIIHVQISGLNGLKLAEQIRSLKTEFSDIPLIALSSTMDRNAKHCEEAGFNGFISKPFRREKFYQILERLIIRKDDQGKKGSATQKKIVTQYSVRESIKYSLRILVAEDNPVNQKLTEMILTKAGYQVDIAKNGLEVIEKYMKNPEYYNLIFMDIQMPELDGIEATRKIRENGYDVVPIIAMSAHTQNEFKKECLDAGMNDFITKPFKRANVFDILEKWIFKKLGW